MNSPISTDHFLMTFERQDWNAGDIFFVFLPEFPLEFGISSQLVEKGLPETDDAFGVACGDVDGFKICRGSCDVSKGYSVNRADLVSLPDSLASDVHLVEVERGQHVLYRKL